MNEINIVYSDNRFTFTAPLSYQYDYGQKIVFSGIDLPSAFEVHFSNEPIKGTAAVTIGQENTVTIPDAYFLSAEPIYGWVYLHHTESSGQTEYTFKIPVAKRPAPSPEEPTPVQQDVITEAIAALNAGVTAAETAAGNAHTSEINAATSASDAAISAANADGSATDAAGYATHAAGSAADAAQSERHSETYAEYAAASERNAMAYKNDAAGYATDAGVYADRAEQAAGNAGYMFFHIDEHGDLIYHRTSNVQVDFYLSDGDLFVRGVA